MKQVNKKNIYQKLKTYRRSPLSFVLLILVMLSALITVSVLLFIIGYILVKGIPNITPDLFAWDYTSENVSLMPAIVNTLLMTALALLLAVPPGIFSAIYLVEYAKRSNKIVGAIRITTETLAGIPSIIYGLFGMLFCIGAWLGFFNDIRCFYPCYYDPSDYYAHHRRSPKIRPLLLPGRQLCSGCR